MNVHFWRVLFLLISFYGFAQNTPQGNIGLYFDGTDDQVAVGSSFRFAGNALYTLEAWVKVPDNGRPKNIFFQPSSTVVGSHAIAIFIESDGRISFANDRFSQGGWTIHSTVSKIPFNTWTHIAVSSNGLGTKSILINGIDQVGLVVTGSSGTTNAYLTATAPNTEGYIGRAGYYSNSAFEGQIDEVKVFNKLRALAEVRADMKSVTPDGATAYWNLDKSNGQNVMDATGGHHAKLGNDSSLEKVDPLWAYRVTNTGDNASLQGTLRWVLAQTDLQDDKDYIEFTIDNAIKTYTISLASGLFLNKPAIIDGYSALGSSPNTNNFFQGNNAVLRIQLDFGAIPSGSNGLTINTDSSWVKGLCLNGLPNSGGSNAGIAISGNGNRVSGCFVGFLGDGKVAPQRNMNGIGDYSGTGNIIGWKEVEDPAAYNLIANVHYNTIVGGKGTVVQGNYVGIDQSGKTKIPSVNGRGILAGFKLLISQNVICSGTGVGSGNGLEVGDSCKIVNNYIGVGVDGITAIGNAKYGVTMGKGSVLGGTKAEANIIAYNGLGGILNSSSSKILQNNMYCNNTINASGIVGAPTAFTAPTLTGATTRSSISLRIGNLDAAEAKKIFFYKNQLCGQNQGEILVFQVNAAAGTDSYNYTGSDFISGDVVTVRYVNSKGSSVFSAPFTVPPVAGAALDFDGVDDYVSCPAGLQTRLKNGTVAVEAWVYVNQYTGWGTIIKNWGNGPTGSFHLGLHDVTQSISVYIATATGTSVAVLSNKTITLNQWHHVAFCADGKKLHLYQDGVEVGTTTYDGTLNLTTPYTNIGCKPGDGGLPATNLPGFFRGKIDELRLWNREVCAAEILQHYNCESLTDTTGLLFQYTFNQGVAAGDNTSLTTLADSSGKSQTATLSSTFAKKGTTSNFVDSDRNFTLNCSKTSICPPLAPKTVTALAGNKQVKVLWNKVPKHSASLVYKVYYGLDSTKTLSTATALPGDTALLITGLQNDLLYYFAVSAGADTSSFDAAVPVVQSGKALTFNGTQGITTRPFIQNKSEFTISAWIKLAPEGMGTDRVIYGEGNPAELMQFMVNTNNRLAYGVFAAGTWPFNQFSTPLPSNEWLFVAVSLAGGNKLSLTVNDKTETFTNTLGNIPPFGSLGRNTSGNKPFIGSLDEISFWNVALDPSKLQALKDKNLQGMEKGLMALYHLDEPTGARVYDATVNGFNVIKTNAPLIVISQAMAPFKPKGLVQSNGLLTWTTPNIARDVKSYTLLKKTGANWDSIATTSVDNANFAISIPCAAEYYKIQGLDSVGQKGQRSDSVAVGNASSLDSVKRAHYNLNNNAQDLISGTVGTVVGSVTSIPDRHGVANSAYKLSGGHINLGQPLIFSNTQSHTIALWIKVDPGVTSGVYSIMSREISTWDNNLYINFNDSSVYFVNWRQGGAQGNVHIGYNFDPQKYQSHWHHILVTYDAVTRIFALYEDGILKASQTSINDVFGAQSYNLLLGRGYATGANAMPNNFLGSMDDFRIYNRVLRSTEITLLAENVVPDSLAACGYIGKPYELIAKEISGATYTWRNPNGTNRTETDHSLHFNPLKITEAGAYTTTVNYGCSNFKDTVVLNIPAIDTAMTASNGNNLCGRSSLTLTANNSPADSLRWFRKTGTGLVKMGNNLTQAVTIAGSYYFRRYVGNCYDSSRIQNIISCPGAPKQVSAIPSHTQVQLRWTAVKEAEKGYRVIYTAVAADTAKSTASFTTTTILFDTSFTAIGLTNDQFYYFAVIAVDGDTSRWRPAVPVLESGKALSLNGTNQYVNVNAAVTNLTGWNAGTLSGWFKSDKVGDTPSIILSAYAQNNYWLQVGIGHIGSHFTDESFYFALARNDTGDNILGMYLRKGSAFYNDGQWHHFAVITGDGDNRILMDGIRQEVTFRTGSKASKEFSNIGPLSATANIRIGNRNLNGVEELHFQGQLDEIALWNTPLTDAQILAIKDKNIIGSRSEMPMPQALWHFDEPTGTKSYDVGIKNLDGTKINAPLVLNSKAMTPYKATLSTTLATDAAVLTWSANQALDVKSILIYRHDAFLADTAGKLLLALPYHTADTTYRDTSVATCHTYRYKVVGVDSAGQIGILSDSSVVEYCLAAPKTLAASAVSTTGFRAHWTAVAGARTYRIQVALDSAFTALVQEIELKDTTVQITGLSPQTIYYYRAYAVKGGSSENPNLKVVATMLPPSSGQALRLGDGAYVRLQEEYLVEGDQTYELWFQTPLAPASNSTLIQGGNWSLGTENGVLGLTSHGDGSNFFNPLSYDLNTLKAGWHHLAVVGTNGFSNFFIDGLAVGQIDYFSDNWIYGLGSEESTGFGAVDELRIWNEALSQTDIQQHMCQKLQGDEEGLLAYYRFDEGKGKVTENKARNSSFDAALLGDVQWITSGAAIGDTSAFNYGGTIVTLKDQNASTNKDQAVLRINKGSAQGLHVYKVRSAPNNTTKPSAGIDSLDLNAYFGVFVVGSDTVVYDWTYQYTYNSKAAAKDTLLDWLSRSNNAAGAFQAVDQILLNPSLKTLSSLKDSMSREYLLAFRKVPKIVLIMPSTDLNYGEDPLKLKADTNVTSVVTYTVSDTTIAKIVDGNKVVPLKNGTVTITASINNGKVKATQTLKVTVPPFAILGRKYVTASTEEIYEISPEVPGLSYAWTYNGIDVDLGNASSSNAIKLLFKKTATDGKLICSISNPLYRTTPIELEKEIIVYHPDDPIPTVDCDTIVSNTNACSGNYLNGIELANLQKQNSGCSIGGYEDYTKSNLQTSVYLGASVNVSLQIGNNAQSQNPKNYVGLWLDYNNNGSFEDAGEFLLSDFSEDTLIELKNIVLSTNVEHAGEHRLRVRVRSTALVRTESCVTYNESGETEDYKIMLLVPDHLEAPVLLSPNDDGKNDRFVIKGINANGGDSKLTILDRLGNVLYEQSNYDNTWSGTDQNGKPLPKDTYYFHFVNGQNTLKGFFELRY